jgi:hypothetical protein
MDMLSPMAQALKYLGRLMSATMPIWVGFHPSRAPMPALPRQSLVGENGRSNVISRE